MSDNGMWEEAAAQPWLLIGPVILTVCIVLVVYIACKRLIDDSSWITPPKRSRLISQTSYIQFKQETPASSLMTSRTDYINLSHWRFLSSFISEPFSKESRSNNITQHEYQTPHLCSVVENSIRIAMAGWQGLSADDLHFYIILDEKKKETIQDMYNAARLDVPEDQTNLSFSTAPCLLLMACKTGTDTRKMGMLLGNLQRSLLACGLWSYLYLPSLEPDQSTDIDLQLADIDLQACGKDDMNLFAICAVGYPPRKLAMPDHQPPKCAEVVQIL